MKAQVYRRTRYEEHSSVGKKHFAIPVAKVITRTRDDGQALVVIE